MLRWNDGDTPEDARWYILNSIFGTVQYSVVLGKAPDAVKSEIAKWIAFADKHRAALLKGRIRPHRPELNYPVVESESDDERIVVIYDPTVAFDPGPIVKRTLVVDATSGAVTEFAGKENPSRRKR
jgi:alpha-galactosidase